MRLSIIIVNHRGWKSLKRCLESLRNLGELQFTWEVIVVDNDSGGDQLQQFVRQFPEFYFLENSGNNGFANGCNFGAKNSSGEFLLFLNPDTIVNAEAISRLVHVAERHPEYTILSCSQVTDKGKDDRPHGVFLRLATLTSFLRMFYKISNNSVTPVNVEPDISVIFPDWVSGSVMLMHRNWYHHLQWDEDFWMYFEDMDICKRVRDQGGQVALIKNTQIIHNHGGASRINRYVKALTKSEVMISRHVYIQKHSKGWRRVLMHSYFVINNIFGMPLLSAILGTLLFFKRSFSSYPRLYLNIVKYYASALAGRTWLSHRSVNYKKLAHGTFETAKAEAA
ncbi:MAG TPA: glycosyltransferase family 2 protein [Cyclobacteriaceae bacterium]|jgi:GT2 family glycosyltransferase